METTHRLEFFVEHFERTKPVRRGLDNNVAKQRPARPSRSRLLQHKPPPQDDLSAMSPPPAPKKSDYEPAPERPTHINPSPSLLMHKIKALRSSVDDLRSSIRESGDGVRGR